MGAKHPNLPLPVVMGFRQRRTEAAARPMPALTRPLRLLFVTPRYLPYAGGVQTHVYQISQRLVKAGVDVTVLTTNPGGRLPAEETVEGIQICRVLAWPASSDYYFAPAMYRFITKGSWDIVHVQSYHTLVAPLAMAAAWRANIPYVVTFHGGGHSSRLRNSIREVQRWLLRPLLAGAERLIATAQFEVSFFGERLGLSRERFAFIPNGADLPEMNQVAIGAVDKGLLISIGRLEPYKGHHRVLRALPHLLQQRPDIRLWIMGSGPFEQGLWHLARQLDVAEHVEIRAILATEREKIARELSRAALVVLLSEYETHPMAILEALALGRSVLVADNSGLRELAEQDLARAVPLQSSPQQVADAILEQLHRPHIPPPIDLPTWDECAENLLALYEEVLKRRKCGS